MDRSNLDSEREILTIRYFVPVWIKVISTIFMILMFTLVLNAFVYGFAFNALFFLMLIPGIILSVVGILNIVCIRTCIDRWKTVITNKRILGYRCHLFGEKTYSYRLDKINNVEVRSTLKFKTLIIQFSQGELANPQIAHYRRDLVGNNILKLKLVHNEKAVYEQLSKLLGSYKNDAQCVIDSLK